MIGIVSRNKATISRILLLLLIMTSFMMNFDNSFANSKGKGKGIGALKVTTNDATGYTVTGVDNKDGWNGVINDYRVVIMAVSGFAVLTLVGAFVIAITRLGASSGNPQARSQAITALLWTGVAIAVIGASGVVFGFFYNVF